MKILYISSTASGMFDQSIYFDLMQEFVLNDHEVYCAHANEKRFGDKPTLQKLHNITYLGVKTGNHTKSSNFIEKGIATLMLDKQFKKAIKKHFGDIDFDMVLVSTPPISFTKTLKHFKKQHVPIYLMLKDIFPQNAIDLNLFKENSLVHKMFKKKELESYRLADVIGCMSPANVKFIADRFPGFADKLCLLPNSIKIDSNSKTSISKSKIGVKEDDVMLLYGGNLGLPQGPEFIETCIIALEELEGVKLVIAGSGSHVSKITELIKNNNIKNTVHLGQLETKIYNGLTEICDIGLIFLDYKFTIPNYPQRLLSYLKEKKPVVCATDPNTDIGRIAEDNGYGVHVDSNDVKSWIEEISKLSKDVNMRETMGRAGYKYLIENYQVELAYKAILEQMKEKQNV